MVENNIKDIANALTSRIVELRGVTDQAQRGYHCFYSGEPSKKNMFGALLLAKDALVVRIKTNPAMVFNDPRHWTKDETFKAFLLLLLGKRQEREFKIDDKGQVEYAMDLFTQAYLQTHEIQRRRPLDRYNEARAVLKYGWKKLSSKY